MNTTIRIGKREKVQDVRLVWKRENDFSNWLVTEDGIALLAESLDIELENLTRESRPGDFSCDIVGNLLGDENHIVVIENQFGKTDHDHLGKLLTYAAMHEAMTGIWISEIASDDHRQVIDWLNENTPTNVNLCLVTLKLYKIGDSPIAPQLDVICRPNLAVKETKRGRSQSEQDRSAWFRRMWTGIHESIKETNPPFRLQQPGPGQWSAISLGRDRFCLQIWVVPGQKCVRIELRIEVSWKTHAFNMLEAHRHEIESELGATLQWLLQPEMRSARVVLESNIDPREPENEAQIRNWFATYTVKMYEVFKDRVLALDEPAMS